MACLRRIPFTKPLPPGAEIIAKRGKFYARWESRGKTFEAPLTTNGQRISGLSRKWYGIYTDQHGEQHTEPLSANKAAAQAMLADRVAQVERARAGLISPQEAAHGGKPLVQHIEDFRAALVAEGKTAPRQVAELVAKIQRILTGCGFAWLRDLEPGAVQQQLSRLRAGRELPPLPCQAAWTKKELAQALGVTPAAIQKQVWQHRLPATGNGKKRRYPQETAQALHERASCGISMQTSNHYLVALKQFANWLVSAKRLAVNPLAQLEGGNVKVDRRHDRRELTADELRRLLSAAQASSRTFRGLSGNDRLHIYATACATGFRAGGLASLEVMSFSLDEEPPTVTLSARGNKSKVLKVQPLPADVAALLRAYLAGRQGIVWAGTWHEKAAEMLRIDLDAAGIPYEVPGPDGPLYADFHALRHTYLTLGSRAGIDLRTLQELAGHSTPVLTARYSHPRLHDLAGAVEKLPSVLDALAVEPKEVPEPLWDAACGG